VAINLLRCSLPGTGKTCAMVDLPDQRDHYTLDNLDTTTAVLCGGGKYGDANDSKSCLQFSQTTGFIMIYIL
jgi:hypothetical protein